MSAQADHESQIARFPRLRGSPRPLTERELQVIRCLSQGLSTRETADKLFVSVKTVESHRARIKFKLKVRNNVEIAAWLHAQAPHCSSCTCGCSTSKGELR